MNMSLQRSTLVRGCRLNVKSDIVVIFVLTQTWCPNFKLIFFCVIFFRCQRFQIYSENRRNAKKLVTSLAPSLVILLLRC